MKAADQRAAVLSLEYAQQLGRSHLAARGATGGAGHRPGPRPRRPSRRRPSSQRVHCAGREAQIASRFDTVTLCLSKGLGCPLGALLAGSSELIARAWREKHLFGGAMRQAGIVAAAGVYALDHHVARLSDDHAARAAWPRDSSPRASRSTSSESRRTSSRSISDCGLDRDEALGRLRKAGVGLSATIHPTVIRAVTHLEITDDDIEQAAGSIAGALLAGARV